MARCIRCGLFRTSVVNLGLEAYTTTNSGTSLYELSILRTVERLLMNSVS